MYIYSYVVNQCLKVKTNSIHECKKTWGLLTLHDSVVVQLCVSRLAHMYFTFCHSKRAFDSTTSCENSTCHILTTWPTSQSPDWKTCALVDVTPPRVVVCGGLYKMSEFMLTRETCNLLDTQYSIMNTDVTQLRSLRDSFWVKSLPKHLVMCHLLGMTCNNTCTSNLFYCVRVFFSFSLSIDI